MSLRAIDFIVGTLVVLLALPVRANEPGPSLEEVLRRSTAIALGRVEQIDGRSGRPIAALRVEHVARGELPDLITISADVIGSEPSLPLGARLIVFLEPAHQGEPRPQLAFRDAASLWVFSQKGAAYVAPRRSRAVSLPLELCEPGIQYAGSTCSVRLDRFLQGAGLKPFTPSRKGATFRVSLPPECPPCTLEDEVAKRWDSGGIDCGSATQEAVSPHIIRCVQEALQQHKPFKVVVPRRGIDSVLVSMFVSDGTRFHEFYFDSSTLGGGKCSALVERHSCQALEFGEGRGEWIQCIKPDSAEVLCSQFLSGVRKLTPPEEVSRLRCAEEQRGRRYNLCEVSSSITTGKNIIPASDGPNLDCSSRNAMLTCWPEQ
jgi:hypothetical protein